MEEWPVIEHGRPRISCPQLGDILHKKSSTYEEKFQALHDYKWGPTPKEEIDADWEESRKHGGR